MYIPILKWRQGEYLALERLKSEIKDSVMPLIEIPPIEWDFAKGRLAKNIDEHLASFPKRLHKKWEGRPAFIDFNLLDSAYRLLDDKQPVTFIFDEIRVHGAHGIPVTNPYRDLSYQEAVKEIIKKDNNGVCFRISFNDIVKNNISSDIASLSNILNVNIDNIDIVLDLGSPNYQPISAFVAALRASLKKIKNLEEYRSFTLISTAFPKSMGEVSKGGHIIERLEWKLYLEYCSKALENEDLPQFGDYAIAHPVLPQQDMRLLKPAASLRYTIDNAWWIEKGISVRDNGFEQYRNICRSIIDSGHFCDADYSEGDEYIKECSDGGGSTGNLSTWRWVGTNHHITKVVHDVASFDAS